MICDVASCRAFEVESGLAGGRCYLPQLVHGLAMDLLCPTLVLFANAYPAPLRLCLPPALLKPPGRGFSSRHACSTSSADIYTPAPLTAVWLWPLIAPHTCSGRVPHTVTHRSCPLEEHYAANGKNCEARGPVR